MPPPLPLSAAHQPSPDSAAPPPRPARRFLHPCTMVNQLQWQVLKVQYLQLPEEGDEFAAKVPG